MGATRESGTRGGNDMTDGLSRKGGPTRRQVVRYMFTRPLQLWEIPFLVAIYGLCGYVLWNLVT